MRLSGARTYYRPSPPKMPPGLVELMEGLTKDVLKHNPSDVYGFCAGHMQHLLEVRDGPTKKKSLSIEEKIAKAQHKIREKAAKRRQEFDKGLLQQVPKESNAEEESNVSEETVVQKSLLPPVHQEHDLSNFNEIEISRMASKNEEHKEPSTIETEAPSIEVSEVNNTDNTSQKDNNAITAEALDEGKDNVPNKQSPDNTTGSPVGAAENMSDSTHDATIINENIIDKQDSQENTKEGDPQISMSEKDVPVSCEVAPDGRAIESGNVKHEVINSERACEPQDQTVVNASVVVNTSDGNDKLVEKDSKVRKINEDASKTDSNMESSTPVNDDSNINKINVAKELNDISKNAESISFNNERSTVLENVQTVEQILKVEIVQDEKGENMYTDISVSNIPDDNNCVSSDNVNKCNSEAETNGIKEANDGALNIPPEETSETSSVITDTNHGNNLDHLESPHEPINTDLKIDEKNQTNEENTNNVPASGEKEVYLENNLMQDDSNKIHVKSSSLTSSIPEDGGCDVPITEANKSTAPKNIDNSITDQLIDNIPAKENHDKHMDLETAAVTIQKVFRNFLFKSRGSTFEDNPNDEDHFSDEESDKQEGEYPTVVSLNKERRHHGITRMDTVLQTVNEEKSLSLSTDDSSTLSSAATIIQAHVRGFLVRNKLNSNKTLSTNSLAASNSHDRSLDNDNDPQKNKTVLNIHIVPEGNYLSRDESLITSVDLSLDGSPPSSINLHPLGYDKSERRKQLKREDAIQSISPPSNNSGKLSEDVDSVKEVLNIDEITRDVQAADTKTTQNTEVEKKVADKKTLNVTVGNDSIETAVATIELENKIVESDITEHRQKSLSKLSSDEMDVVTPFATKEVSAESKLMHSGELHDAVLPTRVSRSDTPVVRGE